MMYKKRGDMMKMIRKNSIRLLTSAMLIGSVVLGAPAMSKEVYPGVNVPDEVYKTEYGDKENYSEIKYYKWTTDANGAKVLTEGTTEDNDLKYYVSSKKDTVKDISGVIKENQNGGDINTNFIDLTLDTKTNAITNAVNNEIGKINADFVNSGGNTLIYSQGNISDIEITAINNFSPVINLNQKDSKIDSITGTFIGNVGTNYSGIYIGSGTVGKITGNFIANRTTTNGNSATAVTIDSSSAHVGSIEGIFIDNYDVNRGGAISNSGIVDSIKGIFINNHSTEGSAIWQYGVVGSIEGYFEGNRGSAAILAYKRGLLGDAKYNIGSIKGIFKNNDGAINIAGQKVGSIDGIFIDNSGYAIYNGWGTPTIESISGYFKNNENTIFNNGTNSTIYNISGNFENNVNAVFNNGVNSKIYNISGNFVNNKRAILNGKTDSKMYSITGNFIKNYLISTELDSVTRGAAIVNKGLIGQKDDNGNLIGGIVNSNFIGNYIKANGPAYAAAIYTSKDLNIIADNGVSTFSGNYTQVGDEKDDNAIYLDNADASLNFQLKNGGRIIMKDNIRGQVSTTTETSEDGTETTIEKHYSVNIQGDDINKTSFYLHNDIYDANVTLGNTTINTINDDVHTYNFHSLRLTDNTNMSVDVDLAKGEMDRFSAKEYGEHQGNLNVVGMNLLSDSQGETTEIMFAEAGLKDNVTNGTPSLPNKAYQTAYTPIYKYDINYDNRTDGGYFVFTRGGKNGGSDSFNPSVLSAPVSSVAASQATINETFKYVFEHADTFTQMPNSVRHAKLNANKYALSTDFNNNNVDDCKLCDSNNKAGWFKPYVTFENMNLKHGPKVDAITYGSLVGYDTDFRELKHGWHSVGTGYIGYNGSQLNYSGVDTTMNGGLLGYTETFYKNNFWTALTLSAGASVGESKTMYGKEDFTSLMAGIGSKTGYNFEFKEGKYILQPIMFMSYTFVNTFDYTNAGGVKVKPSPAHSIQLNPSVRFIANTKNGWQPYASVGMVWNVMNENKVTANNVRLPEMGMKPYVEYGVGLQRNWKDRFTAYGQAMIRNGGRNGIALTGGMRWALGKEGKPIEKVQTDNSKIAQQSKTLNQVQSDRTRKVLKQLSPSQKTALGKSQNTTRTTNSAIIKSL